MRVRNALNLADGGEGVDPLHETWKGGRMDATAVGLGGAATYLAHR